MDKNVIFLIIIILLLVYIIGKLHRTASRFKKDIFLSSKKMDNLFHQMQCLHGLYYDLGFKRSLPKMRGWAASPDFLLEIATHALREQPKTVVECGSGVSTIVLARCMERNKKGHVFSLEHVPDFAEQTRSLLREHGLSEFATVIDAPLKEYDIKNRRYLWYSAEALKDISIDMLVIDGPPLRIGKLARYPAGHILFDKLNHGGYIFLDDAARSDEQIILKLWAEEFPALEQTDLHCEKGCSVLRISKHGVQGGETTI